MRNVECGVRSKICNSALRTPYSALEIMATKSNKPRVTKKKVEVPKTVAEAKELESTPDRKSVV